MYKRQNPDGSAVADVDLTKITDNIAYDSGKLEWGEHLLKIEVLSQDKKVDIDYIECTDVYKRQVMERYM